VAIKQRVDSFSKLVLFGYYFYAMMHAASISIIHPVKMKVSQASLFKILHPFLLKKNTLSCYQESVFAIMQFVFA